MRVQFPLVKEPNNNLIVYPDTRQLFAHVQIAGGVVTAEYSGTIPLDAAPDEAPTKFVGMTNFGELLPDDALVAIYDIRNGTAEPPGKRRAAARVLLAITTDRKVDVYGSDFGTLLGQLVGAGILTQLESDAILTELRSDKY